MAIKIPAGDSPPATTLLEDARPVADEWYRPLPPVPAQKWRVWVNLPTVELWQAITLTCGIEPEYYLGDANRDFADRLSIAIGNGLGKGARPHCALVTLKDVARLAHRCGWTLPPEFPGANPLENAVDPTPPNWDRWLHVPSIELGNAIALTLDIDPKCLSSGRHLILDTFVTRLQVAIEHLQEGGVLAKYAARATPESIKVCLDDVAALARRCNWSLPLEFPRAVLPDAETTERDPHSEVDRLVQKATAKPAIAVHKATSRRNILDFVIKIAKDNAANPQDYQSVWAELCKMAEQTNPTPPLFGWSSEGIQYKGARYQDSQEPDVFTKDALRKRMQPRAR